MVFFRDTDSIEIIGNKSGLEDLADICNRLAVKVMNNTHTRAHFHLFVGINSVNGSNETVITFDPEIAPSKRDYELRRFEFLKKKYGNKGVSR